MNVLVACEESQRVCAAFRGRGHNAFSCDIVPCSRGNKGGQDGRAKARSKTFPAIAAQMAEQWG